jgi:hypothetical protein
MRLYRVLKIWGYEEYNILWGYREHYYEVLGRRTGERNQRETIYLLREVLNVVLMC